MNLNNIYKYILSNNLSPNGLYILQAIRDKLEISNIINISTEYYKLEKEGYVYKDNNIYKLSGAAILALQEIDKILLGRVKKEKNIELDESFILNISKYNNLFPSGRRPNSTTPYRSSETELIPRFMWFFKKYPNITWDIVLKATEIYIKSSIDNDNLLYLKSAKYLVKKEEIDKTSVSALADLCISIIEGNDTDFNTGYRYD